MDGVQRTLYAPKDGAALRRSYATANCNPCRCHQSRHCEKAEACPGTTARKLDWLASLYVRDETYAKALAELVKHHHRHAFAEHWGEGKTASSDGQRFRAGGRGEATGQVNLRYGNEPGVLFYTHISDQYTPFYSKVIAANARDATYVLDGLLYHESDLRIEEHYTDTAGFTDHVFALCHLLGFRFAPRIRDLADKRLYVPNPHREYAALAPLVGGRLQLKLKHGGRKFFAWPPRFAMAPSPLR